MSEELPHPLEDDPKCAECSLSIEEGSVVAFGNHIWHVDCFRCCKCSTIVDHDSNLLLLNDGMPICENCSYNCRVCNKKIDDLAIMTGDESYHSDCFRCRTCQRKIEDLVFAKTSQGIYCIACHNERMSKSRKTRSSRALLQSSRELKEKTLPSVPQPEKSLHLANNIATGFSSDLSKYSTPLPSPSRKPPLPPSVAGPKDSFFPHAHINRSEFEDDSNSDSQLSPSLTVPVILDAATSSPPDKRFSSAAMSLPQLTGLATPEPEPGNKAEQHNGDFQQHGGSVQERRRPTAAELRLPGSQADTASCMVPQNSEQRSSDVRQDPGNSLYSLFPTKLDNSLRSPLPFPSQSADEDPLRDSSTSHSPRGAADSIAISATPDLQADTSATPKASKHSATFTSPSIPDRSAERLSGRAISKPSSPLVKNVSSSSTVAEPYPSGASRLLPPPDLDIAPDHTSSTPSRQVSDQRSETSTTADPLTDGTPERSRHSRNTSSRTNSQLSTPVRLPASLSDQPISQSTRHHVSKSLEKSPAYTFVPGSPVTLFENDLSRAFNLSPQTKRNSQTSFQHNDLERSGTLSRMASRVLKHRKSVSGSTLSPGHDRRASGSDSAADLVALRAELTAKTNRISYLEQSLSQVSDARVIETELAARKSLLANLEVQLVQSGAEQQSYLHHRHRISDMSIPLGEWKANVVADMATTLKQTKDSLAVEIEQMLRQRNDLKLENKRLILEKTKHEQELVILEQRKVDLNEVHESMLRQIQDNMEAHKDSGHPRTDAHENSPMVRSESTSLSDHVPRSLYDKSLAAETEPVQVTASLRTADIEEEEEPVVEAAVKRLSGERFADAATAKKFNLVKKTKKAFRWGRTPSAQDTSLAPLSTYNSGVLSLSERTMSSSKSSDKLSLKSSGSGMFKRTWHSQQSLSSHLENKIDDSPSTQTLFGNDLGVQAQAEGKLVPQIVVSCISSVESRALEFEGLYRKSGGAGEMRSLVEAFELANTNGQAINIPTFFDISAITSVLKQYLRKLPIPLVTFDNYEPFIGTSAIPDTTVRIRAVKEVLRDLPEAHYETLRAILKHLHRVSEHSSINLMTTKNLAVVLGPSIIWDQAGEKEIVDMHDKNSCIQFCIDHAEDI